MTLDRRGWTNQLLVWARSEMEEQKKLLAALVEEERCISGGTPADVTRATTEVVRGLEREAERRSRLAKILRRLAAELCVPASTLTLGAAAERLGGGPGAQGVRDPLAGQLWTLRGELRQAVGLVVEQNRRVAAVMGVQRAVVRDVLGALLSGESGNPVFSDGTLIDANA